MIGVRTKNHSDERIVNVVTPPQPSNLTKPLATFRGGYSQGVRGSEAFLRMVRLDIFSNGVRIAPVSRLLRLFVPTWESSLDQLSEVGISGVATMRGVRFSSVNNRPSLTFVPHRDFAEVTAALTAAGATVHP